MTTSSPRFRDLTPSATKSPELAKPTPPQGPKREPSTRNPTFEQLSGAWDHSTLHTGILVTGDEVMIERGRYRLVSSQGRIEMEGWLLQSYTGDEVVWKARGGPQKCSWYRTSVAPKRERKASLVQAEVTFPLDIHVHVYVHVYVIPR